MNQPHFFLLGAMLLFATGTASAQTPPWHATNAPTQDTKASPVLKVRWTDQSRGAIEVLVGADGARSVAVMKNDDFDANWCDLASDRFNAVIKKWTRAEQKDRESLSWAYDFVKLDEAKSEFLFWVYPHNCIGNECPDNMPRCKRLGKKLMALNLDSGAIREVQSGKLRITCRP